jgi:hypothetical protein
MAVDFPYPPALDMEWTNPETGKLYRYDGESWRLITEDLIGGCATPDSTICDKITEIEEEFENLLPSLDRGSWEYNEDFTKPPGKFGLRTEQGGLPTQFEDAVKIILHEIDAEGEPHGFGDIKVDSYIQLFQSGTDDTAIYHVDALPVKSGDEFTIEVSFVRSLGDYPELDEAFRFKFYEIVGADADAYVLRTGDTMTGNLNIGKDPDTATEGNASLNLTGRITGENISVAHVSFHNENAAASYTGFIEYYSFNTNQYFKFNRHVNLNGQDIYNVKDLGIGNGRYINAVSTNRIKLRQNGSSSSSEGNAAVEIISAGESKRCFAVRGRRSNGAEGDLVWTDKDSFYYDGRVDSNTKVANKKYVDDKVKNAVDNIDVSGPNDYVRTTSSSYNANIKLYKSNGVFYITGG